ncbi:MAG TPA: hypothetical protein VGO68_13210 [Pyrinomonadaceae bacterium]|jgi:hypothetical protein|nr:hypothetical protein [Pyrinomonadaceae bacterium]
MRKSSRTIRAAILVAVVLFTGVTAYLAQSARRDGNVRQPAQSAITEKSKDDIFSDNLASLLSRVGVKAGNLLASSDSPNHKELRIHWESFGKSHSATLLLQDRLEARGVLTRTLATVRTGALPRERAFEPSPDHVLVVALDEKDAVRWSRLITDPRLVRAEIGPATAMHSEKYYLSTLDFVVECPADPLLQQLRFYQLAWDGREFQPGLVGSVSLQ